MVFGIGRKKKFAFSCGSVGMDCGFEVKGASSEEEVLEILKIHAKDVHNMTEISDDIKNKIKQNIKKV
ncbi:DUF1059 domain-containing protein [Saccharolobus solfataricus]|nr:DUF1059 domain-containing protein [Saccharolobus solfataricus]AKA77840.1 DUF1059 domain-containing protein [Saccharolobus solfataricus]AKA80536.1 DUF1059 domain-containing protein [Saccharolobus solfataricus]AZF69584.1 DUF1059 domain-containing protein [Saccharolobus solfataricus]AZF72204.1 DUF1059 domain-containing protein [Saccharolobus solfataricus]